MLSACIDTCNKEQNEKLRETLRMAFEALLDGMKGH